MPDDTGRPDPLGDAVKSETPAAAAVGTIITALLGAGLLTTSGINTLNLVLVIAAATVSGGTALLSAHRVAKAARPGVTPTGDPRTDTGDELVPRTSALLVDVLQQLATSLAPPAQPSTSQPSQAAATSLAAGAPPPPARLLAAPSRTPGSSPAAAGAYPDYYPAERLWPDPAPAEAFGTGRRGRHAV